MYNKVHSTEKLPIMHSLNQLNKPRAHTHVYLQQQLSGTFSEFVATDVQLLKGDVLLQGLEQLAGSIVS